MTQSIFSLCSGGGLFLQHILPHGIMKLILKKSAWGIQAKLLFALGIVALIPIIIFVFLTYFLEGSENKAHSGLYFQEIATAAASTLKTSIASELKKLEAIALSPKLQTFLSGTVEALLTREEKELVQNWEERRAEDPAIQKILTDEVALYLGNFVALEPGLYREIFITDLRGFVVAATRKPQWVYVNESPWWVKMQRTGKPVFYLEEKHSEHQLTPILRLNVATPIYSTKAPRLIGAIHATLNFNQMLDFLREIHFGKTGIAYFIASQENISYSTRFIGKGFVEPPSVLEAHRQEKTGWDTYLGPREEKRIRGFATLLSPELSQERLPTPSHWILFVDQDLDETLSPLYNLMYTTIAVCLIVITASFYFGLRSTRRIVHPLRRLQESARQIGLGTLKVHLPLDRQDEIGDLAMSFNQMVENLKKFKEENLAKSLALSQANEELRRQNLLKGNFLSMVSHELRTPLTTLAGYMKFLKDGKAGPLAHEQFQCLTAADKQIRHLTYLIEQLLDISRIESGRQEVNASPVYIQGVVHDCLAALSEKAAAKEITIENLMSENLSLVYADRHHLVQIITNLIDNALKYNPQKGTITIRGSEKERYVETCVSDSGQGIPPEFQQKVFEKFFRLEEGPVQPETGLGLGLAIVKELVELNGGRIWLESKLGQGSQFYFVLPKYGIGL